MLTLEENELLARVGPDTPCGELMRRYWMPVAATAELDEEPVLAVKVLGENLALYRTDEGKLGLVSQRCPHRGASLAYGIPEEDGLRCPYHGWRFDQTGQCNDMPAEPEDSTFKHRIRVPAYPVQELGGLIWAYLGPEPVPLLPRLDVLVWDDAWRDVGVVTVPCNWLQCMENSVDLTHVDYLHGWYYDYVLKRQGRPVRKREDRRFKGQKQVDIGFDLFEFGIKKRRRVEGAGNDYAEWKEGSNPVVFPIMTRAGGRGSLQIRVPVDDTHTRCYLYSCYRPDDGLPVPPQANVPMYGVPLEESPGRLKTDWITGQDFMAWLVQGPLMDRSTERLGTSDQGVIFFRRVVHDQIDRVQAGDDPLGVIRDPERNQIIELKPDEVGPVATVRYMDNHWHQFSPIFHEAKALMLRHRETSVAEATPNPVSSNQ